MEAPSGASSRVSSSAGVCIQGSRRISSSEGRADGLEARHRRIRALQSVGVGTQEISTLKERSGWASIYRARIQSHLRRHELGSGA